MASAASSGSQPITTNVAVCGIFHFRKHIGHYAESGLLQRFYYSHRIATTAKSLGLADGQARNLWPKEYLLRLAYRLAPNRTLDGSIDSVMHRLWEWQLLQAWQPCDLFHVMLHGTALRALQRARQEGAVTVGEPVMAHPQVLHERLRREHDILGIPPPPQWKPFERLQQEVEQCDHLVVGSNAIRDSFVASGMPGDRLSVVPYAVDSTRFFPLTPEEKANVDDGKFRVICVGQITPRKGIHYLLEAWRRLGLPSTRAELMLVGTLAPEMRPVLKRYEGLFTHVGSVAHEELRLHYGRASVFVLPSVEDGFGLVTAEAMGCGLPVIVTRAAGSADIVEDGKNGFVVESCSAESLQQAIEVLWRDEGMRTAFGEHSLWLSCRKNTWKDYAASLARLHVDYVMSKRFGSSPAASPRNGLGG